MERTFRVKKIGWNHFLKLAPLYVDTVIRKASRNSGCHSGTTRFPGARRPGILSTTEEEQLLKPLGHRSTYQPGLQSKTLRSLLFLTQKSKNRVYDKQSGLLIHDTSLVDDVRSSIAISSLIPKLFKSANPKQTNTWITSRFLCRVRVAILQNWLCIWQCRKKPILLRACVETSRGLLGTLIFHFSSFLIF